jgi:hypothetical protein
VAGHHFAYRAHYLAKNSPSSRIPFLPQRLTRNSLRPRIFRHCEEAGAPSELRKPRRSNPDRQWPLSPGLLRRRWREAQRCSRLLAIVTVTASLEFQVRLSAIWHSRIYIFDRQVRSIAIHLLRRSVPSCGRSSSSLGYGLKRRYLKDSRRGRGDVL